MVYCGKPSKACGECRLRRTRCDTKKPSCTQCLRAGRTCMGYRDINDLIFRDESKGLSEKHRRSHGAHFQVKAESPRPVDPPLTPVIDLQLALIKSPQSTQFQPLPTLSLSLMTSPEDQATCFFFQNYVLGGGDLSRGNLNYLSDIYVSEEIGGGLADSISSLGMVGLANFWKAPNIMSNAALKYNSAMQKVSTQLRDVEQAKADQTLISILLMGLYETNTCSSRQSMEAWTKHITGATALMQLRGKEALKTPLGYQMFLHLRGQVLTSCIQRHAPIPQIITDWSNEIDFETPEQAAATALLNLCSRYCNLRSSMGSFQDYSDPERIITTACAINNDYDLWAKTVPLEYIYQTVTLRERSEEVFSDHYHVYPNLWIATAWNNYRACRILINELILDQLCHLYLNNPESTLLWNDTCFFENQVLASNTTLLQLCHDICASVPFYLGFDPNADKQMPRAIPRAISGNLLLWPLYSAGVTDLVSDMMRDWVAGRLRWISDIIGIRQAAPLALSLRRKQDLVQWKDEKEDDDITSLSSSVESPAMATIG